jgi:hypothetical protein
VIDRVPSNDNVDDEDSLTPALVNAIACLRADEPVSAEWRRSLIEGVEAARRKERVQRRLIGIAGLAAAAAVCAVLAHPASRGIVSVANANAVHFEIDAPRARHVSLVGDFDGWNPTAMPMQRGGNGAWAIDVQLPPGRHAFAFSVDGRLAIDPTAAISADDNFGVPSSVVVVDAAGRE